MLKKYFILSLLILFNPWFMAVSDATEDASEQESVSTESSEKDQNAKTEDANLKEAEAFIKDLGSKAIHVLTAKKDNPVQQKKEFEEIFINHFAVKSIATFVLGRYRRTATTEEKKEFFELFKQSIADVYTERFKNYQNESFVVSHARPAGGKTKLIRVYSDIKKPNASPIEVEWKVFKDSDGEYRITDVIVEGLSMSTTQRSEYSSIIENHGGSLSGLNKVLKKRLAE
jgi:phospholipid transport system substrate-binding protein